MRKHELASGTAMIRPRSAWERKEEGDDRGGILNEVRRGVEGVMEAFEEYKSRQNARVDLLETALRRTGAPGLQLDSKSALTVEQKAFGGMLRRGVDGLPELERKSLSVGDDTSGGYLVTSEFEREIIRNLVEMSPIRSAARVGQMRSSEIVIPRRTGAPTGNWVGEVETRTGTGPAYGQVAITAHEMAAYVDVSVKLLEDAEFNVEEELAFDLAEEFARLEGAANVLGDGMKKPYGFLAASSDVSEVPSLGATTVTADALINILYDLPAYYRNRSSWMMNGTTLAAVRKLKDTTNQYLWAPGLAPGQPETLLGRPVVECTDMPDVAASSYPIAVGDFRSGYRIYDRTGMSVLRDPFTLATTGQVRFHARRRVGGDVTKAEAIRKMKVSAS